MDIRKLCLDMGTMKAEEIPVSKLSLEPGLRQFCELNHCGRYNRSHTCPPAVGDVETLIRELKTFDQAVIWQNIYPLEDSFDLEGMMEGQKQHSGMAIKIARIVYKELGRSQALVLSAGSCSICDLCGCITGEPCRHPEDALISLEAYGINVTQISQISGLRYINGANTVTYFAGVFTR